MNMTTSGAPVAIGTKPVPQWAQNIESIPTLPTVAGRLIEMALNEKTSANEIGELISKDPGLTARLLKAVNSTSYGLRSEVSSVSHAISIVGRQALRSLVLGISIFDTMKSRDPNASHTQESLWRHAVATAAAAQLIAETVGKVNSEEAYIAGLMHDIGKVALDMLRPGEFRQAVHLTENASIDQDREFEQKSCGIDHTAIGGLIAEKWALPSGLRGAVLYHHDPAAASAEPTPIRRIIAITRAADVFADRCGYGAVETVQPPEIDKVTQELLSRVNEATAVQRVKDEVRKCAEVFRYEENADPNAWQKRLYSANAELSKAFSQVAEAQRIQQKSTELIIQTQKFLGEKDLIGLVLKETVEKLGFDRAYFLQISDDQRNISVSHFFSADSRGTELVGRSAELPDATMFTKPTPITLGKGQNPTHDSILQMLGVSTAVVTPIMDENRVRYLLGTDRGNKLSANSDSATVDATAHQLFAPSISLLLANDRLYKKAHYLSVTDVLTGVANRRSLMENFEDIAQKAEQKKLSFCIAMYDIDFFKKFNDESGHQVGDQVLRAVAQTIRQSCRSYDMVGRYGGEEFCVILPSTTLAEAQGIAERIRQAVESYGCSNAARFGGRSITVSGGLSCFTKGEKHEALLGRADAALYRAKQNGRNRLEISRLEENS